MFDRFDICEAYSLLEEHWNHGGWLQERPSNQRRGEACSVQLNRIGFKRSPMTHDVSDLSENGQRIYREAEIRLGLVARHVHVCDACATGISNDDWSHVDANYNLSDPDELEARENAHASIAGTLELLGWLTHCGSTDLGGYFACEACGVTDMSPAQTFSAEK